MHAEDKTNQTQRNGKHLWKIDGDTNKDRRVFLSGMQVEPSELQNCKAYGGGVKTDNQIEQILQAVMCAASETVVVLDREGILLDANPAAVQRLGGSLEAIRGVCIYDLFDSQTGARRKAIHQEVCCSRQSLFYKDQREGRTIENHLCPVIDDNGEVSKVVVFSKDITENHRKDRAIYFTHTVLDVCQGARQIQELLDQLIKEIRQFTGCQAIGIRLLDDHGNIPYEAFEGFSQEFYAKENFLSVTRDHCMCIYVVQGQTDPSKPFFTPFGSFYMNGTSAFLATVHEEEKGKTRNACNEYGYETVALVPIKNKEKILGLIHLADSRSDMMPLYRLETIETAALQLATTIAHFQSQNKLEESEKCYRMLVENQNDLVVRFDIDLNLLYASPSYCKTFGKTEQEILYKPFLKLIREEDIAAVQKSLSRLRQHPYVTQHEERALTADGWRWFSWTAKAIFSKEGLIESFVSVGRDITEQKIAENLLKESETKLRTAFNSSPVGMALLGIDGYFQMVNEVLCQMLGYSKDEMLRLSYLDITVPEDVEPSYRKVQSLLEGQAQNFTYEKRYLRKDGAQIWATVSVGMIHDVDGVPAYLVAQIQDTTFRKQAEEQLQFQAMILDQIQDHITATDMDGIITYVNHQEKTLFETDSNSLIGKHISIYGENPKEGATQQEILDNTKKFGTWRGEVVNYTSDGQPHVMDCRTQLLCDEKGQTRGIVGISSDITERKRIEKQLTESEERYRALAEFSPVSVVIMQNQKYVWANPKTIELLGLENADQLIGKGILDYLCPEFHTAVRLELKNAEQGQPTEPIEVRMIRSDGEKVWIKVRSVPIHLLGHPATLIVSDDITTRKNHELQMQEYQRQLKELINQLTIVEDAERKRIAVELHDQIGQSLVLTKMQHDMLTQTLGNAKEKTIAEGISGQLGTIIQETQSLTYNLGSITLYERGLCRALEEWINEEFVRRYSIEVCFKHNIQISLEDHIKSFLFRTARELLVNVAKHARARRAAIALTAKDGNLHLTVEDDGIGYKTSIRTTKDKTRKHFGLLSIRERLDYLKGRIIIDSERNQGTKITIVIPVKPTNHMENKQQ